MTKQSEAENYAHMQKSLEKIVAEISDPNLDLDHLITQVEAGYDLINKMKMRLGQTTKKIENLHAEHQSEAIR